MSAEEVSASEVVADVIVEPAAEEAAAAPAEAAAGGEAAAEAGEAAAEATEAAADAATTEGGAPEGEEVKGEEEPVPLRQYWSAEELESLSGEDDEGLRTWTGDAETRFALVRSIGAECLKEEELMVLMTKKPHPICYDGFEPSGRMHIAQGVLKSIYVNKLTAAGCIFKFWVADWFAMLNNKMGGDLRKIRKVGEYMIEVWKACGMDMRNVQFLWSSEEINARPDEYWTRVMDIARTFNMPRILRCCTIMGRKETEDMSAAQVMYPCMQCADIFFLKADICQLGMDQRKVNVLAREYVSTLPKKKRPRKPIILSHAMVPGLAEGQEKMSKSMPDTAIFMEDAKGDVKRKIRRAYCPPGVVEGNPCMSYVKMVVFPKFGEFLLERSDENGGNKMFNTYEELQTDYLAGSVHPGDLKTSLTRDLNRIIQPVRDHFSTGAPKALLKAVRKLKVTR